MWRYGIVGGIGGLAPVGCQALALFLPNLVGGTEKYNQATTLLPHTGAQLIVCLTVLVFVFLIAAGVVYATIEGEAEATISKAFLIGVSVPSMILSLANGTAHANRTTQAELTTVHQYQITSSTTIENTPYIRIAELVSPGVASDMYHADNGVQSAEFRIRVTCSDCQQGLNPASLINLIELKASNKTYIDVNPSRSSTNPTAWTPLPSTLQRRAIEVYIPDSSSAASANVRISRGATTAFEPNDGGRWTIEIVLSPGAYNPLLVLVGASGYFDVEDVRTVRDVSA